MLPSLKTLFLFEKVSFSVFDKDLNFLATHVLRIAIIKFESIETSKNNSFEDNILVCHSLKSRTSWKSFKNNAERITDKQVSVACLTLFDMGFLNRQS